MKHPAQKPQETTMQSPQTTGPKVAGSKTASSEKLVTEQGNVIARASDCV